MKDPFIENVHRRILAIPTEEARQNPLATLISVSYQEARAHRVLYAWHLAISYCTELWRSFR